MGLEGGKGGGNLFRAVGRIFGQVGDVVESGGMKNARGELVTDEGGIGEVWSCCFEELLSGDGIVGGWELGCRVRGVSGEAGWRWHLVR